MNYEAIGLKCGLEIHQQLNTTKLFCDCPSIIRDDKPDFEVKRVLRARKGETGILDAAALAETKKNKHYLYQGYHDTTCLVELDEEPPQPLDEQALQVALQVAKMLKSHIISHIRVMRKTVVDGSNTTGFQRTALISLGGILDDVRIDAICLEEDAAKIVQRTSTHDTYNLSRLGIPLIEIATAPDIKTPSQAKEVAYNLGMLLRSTGKVKRGLGTIRQDLNVSIKGGVRVEIKGVQDLKLIPDYVDYEIIRQQKLIDIFRQLKKKNAQVNDNIVDLTELFTRTQAKVISSALKNGGVVKGIVLKNFKGFLGQELNPGRRLGSEYADYAKTQGVKGLFHSDELPNYGITQAELQAVQSTLSLASHDAFIIIADQEELVNNALQAVIARAQVLDLVSEVRQAKPDASTIFMRPMPGAARMYPETDIPMIEASLDNISLPELITDKTQRYIKQYNISADFAATLAKEAYPFDEDVKRYSKVSPNLIAECFVSVHKDLKKRFTIEMSQDHYEESIRVILAKLHDNKISTQAIMDLLVLMSKHERIDWDMFKPFDDKKLDKILKEVVAKDPQAPLGALMGEAMKRLGGKADGKVVMSKLKVLIGK